MRNSICAKLTQENSIEVRWRKYFVHLLNSKEISVQIIEGQLYEVSRQNIWKGIDSRLMKRTKEQVVEEQGELRSGRGSIYHIFLL